MTVLSDKWIKKVAKQKGMIKPFVDKQVRRGKFPSVYRLMDMMPGCLMSLKFFTNVNSGIVDPKVFKKRALLLKLEKNV